MKLSEAIHLRIAQLQEKKGLRDAELSRKSGVPKTTISTLKHKPDQCPSLLVIEKLARALDHDLCEFFRCSLFENSEEEDKAYGYEYGFEKKNQ